MPVDVRIPKIGISMTEATLSEWLAKDGAMVDVGAPLYTIEMDKAISEITAPAAGRLKTVGQVGDVYNIGDVIATIE